MIVIHKGWSIRLPYDYYALAGVLFWAEPPDHLKAIRTAVFATRKRAIEEKKKLYYGGRVVRVTVEIKETK